MAHDVSSVSLFEPKIQWQLWLGFKDAAATCVGSKVASFAG
jgi:hypothetical protein